ncbi:hypothetical protein [Pelotomaculum propionicicum]|uniref:Uncharacterized protein n=1 Tax=Pelotomaculum propionicicum TaxID=258475 RepID=A0A4Y7RVM1_9FIRM|nr:hypothetical protein [Pelotomaculum propionicicum]TEB12722.1 hypothetical protein Pmgp_00693 [Pelotomaculum propionicicum]
MSFGRFIGKEIVRGLYEWERRQNMSDWQLSRKRKAAPERRKTPE